MIKATAVARDGTPVLLLGLSGENVTRLVAGEPIHFDAAELGWSPCHVIVTYGRTEADIEAELRQRGLP